MTVRADPPSQRRAADPDQPTVRPQMVPVGERTEQPAALRLRQYGIGRIPDERVAEQADLPTTLLTGSSGAP